VVTETGEVINTEQDLDEVIVQGQSNNYEVVINDTYKTTTTAKQPESIFVFANQKLKMKLQKNNGDTINADSIWWKVGKERTYSTLTKEINVVDKNISVIIYEIIKDKKDDKIIANIEFIVRKSPYVTFSTLEQYDGEFGFDDGEDFRENSVPKQTMQYDTIHVADEKNKTKILYVPWLTLLQGQSISLNVKISEEIEGDNIYVESPAKMKANYDRSNNQLTIENNGLNNDFGNPAYVSLYWTDKYKLQKEIRIGKVAVVGRPSFKNKIAIQIVYFASDSIRLKNTVNIERLKTLLNSNSLNQAFVQFEILPNIIYMRDTLGGAIRAKYDQAYRAIYRECGKRQMILTNIQPLKTVYIVMTELQFIISGNNDVAVERGGGVMDNYNLVIMWLINNTKEDKEKMIIHEIGHSLGLSDVFKDVELGGHPDNPIPKKNLTKANYMDYYIQRRMFFRRQIDVIINNLERNQKSNEANL
jgi:hypothetical protein